MRVLLVQMPFFTLDTPSIGLSLLRSALEQAGFECEIAYLNVEFGRRLGVDPYTYIAGAQPDLLLGDLIFAPSLHDREIGTDRLRTLLERMSPQVIDAFPGLARRAREFLEDQLQEVDWTKYQLVGFGTMFQIAPALAMARMIKSLKNPPPVILGGSYCEAEMGEHLARNFGFLDFVARGESEQLIVDLAHHLSDGSVSIDAIPGLVWREGAEVRMNGERGSIKPRPSKLVALGPSSGDLKERELDQLPMPRYDDWFRQIRATGLLDDDMLRLPIQTSRGCWYGAKRHCTFCGLNDETIAYRSKSPERVLLELRALERYGVKMVHAVDDIFDFRYFKTLLPELSRADLGFDMFYEIKSNLSFDQLKLLKDSRITWIQPGIESLSTPLLGLMKKGVTGFQNLRLLRYAAELEIGIAWNLLYGFPGEDPGEFLRMAELLPSLAHLQPPSNDSGRVQLMRFSPLFVERDAVGLAHVAPVPASYEIYPFEETSVSRMAYYFDHGYATQPDPSSYVGPMLAAKERWHEEVGSASFTSLDRRGAIHLFDTRRVATNREAALRGFDREVFAACLHGAALEEIAVLEKEHAATKAVLDRFVENRWLAHLDGKYLSLAVPMEAEAPLHVPAPMLSNVLTEMYRARMARQRAGFAHARASNVLLAAKASAAHGSPR